MIRIGIVGSDNSHAIALSQLCNLSDTEAQRAVKGARVVALYGRVAERNEEVAEKGKIPKIVKRHTDMIGDVDMVFVVFRHGGLHYRHVRAFLEARIPAFVDKPFAGKASDAMKMIALAKRKRVLLTSFSTVRFSQSTADVAKQCADLGGARSGTFAGPCDPVSEYGGVHFYGIHAVEVMQEVMGLGVTAVSATQTGGNTLAMIEYPDGRNAAVHLNKDAKGGFFASAFCTGGYAGGPLDTSDCYLKGILQMLGMYRKGKRPLTYAQMLEPIRVLDAIAEAVATGTTVKLRKVKA